MLDPVDGPLSGGEPSTPSTPSDPPDGVITRGCTARLGPVAPTITLTGGSMSSDVRNEVLSNSGLVLAIVTKLSRRLFCSGLGVPFRSKT